MNVHTAPSLVFPRRYTFQRNWYQFWAIYQALNRQDELNRLIQWATRKRLSNPRRLYERRLLEEEQRLQTYSFREPRMMLWARVLHGFVEFLFPPSRYPAKGSAAKYRYPRVC